MADMRSTKYIHLGTENLYFDQCLFISVTILGAANPSSASE